MGVEFKWFVLISCCFEGEILGGNPTAAYSRNV